jgi:hypothetical protein
MCGLEINIKVHLKVIVCENINWLHLIWGRG